ncbi:UNVERIFIED_CONTAM: hypothetical protein GTU68_048661 [Idotea baltica]|nr:hypothetical protein [Idotea baltica]
MRRHSSETLFLSSCLKWAQVLPKMTKSS